MITVLKYWFIVCLVYLPLVALAQADSKAPNYGHYFIDDSYLVFEFDANAYADAVKRGGDSLYVEFSDLDLLAATSLVAPESWQHQGWTLRKTGEKQFQLRKKLIEFKDKPNWLLRLLSSGVVSNHPDTVLVMYRNDGLYHLHNPNLPELKPSETGNVLFLLKGFDRAKQVILAGSFNQWDEQALHMIPDSDGGWSLRLQLSPGVYEYKFIADGRWMEDPANSKKLMNEHGTWNSILEVRKPIRFFLPGYTEAHQVILSGTFNEWDKQALKMEKRPDGWLLNLPLIGGKHLYKFIVDGNWFLDPNNRRIEDDRDGNTNSVLFVK